MKTPMHQFHTIKRAVAALAAVFALQTPLAATDLAARMNIPFPFYVGHTLLPAGEYTVSSRENGKAIQLQGKGGNAMTVVSYQTPTRGESPRTVVVFHRYGDASFLAELKGPGGGQTLVLAQSGTEKRVRKNSPPVRIATTVQP